MGRPKKKENKIDGPTMADALLLAGRYPGMLLEKENMEAVLAGTPIYTEDMAIDELSGTVTADTERVQTSGTSNPTERIALLLENGFVEKRNAQIRKEAYQSFREYLLLCEHIRIVETAMKERMDERTKAVFLQIFVKGLPWSRVKDEYGNVLSNKQISRAKEKAVVAIAEELKLHKVLRGLEGENGETKKELC